MNYPYWDAGMGYGFLMALISILHVFISHFAVGGGFYLVIVEMLARRQNNAPFLEYLRRLSKFFILLTLVTGALTGVGIWFIIGLLNPAATEALIHNFVWGWATEWSFFVIEIAAAILYYYGWECLSPRRHLILGWIYFGAAYVSLFVINGIVSFMLTPGAWLRTGNFWDGLFNPTFWPSLILRSGVSILLAGLFAQVVAPGEWEARLKSRLVRLNASWGLAGLLIALPAFYWYWLAIPASVREKAVQLLPTPMLAIHRSIIFASLLLALLILIGMFPKLCGRPVALFLLIVGMGWFGSFEWFRESIRKPYVIHGYMYGTGIAVAEGAAIKAKGILANLPFRSGNDGRDIFRRACGSCHTLRGYKGLGQHFDGMDIPFIASFIKGAHSALGNMPEFLGTDQERQQLAEYLASETDRRTVAQIYHLEGTALGRKVFALRCGICHQLGGFRDPSAAFAGADYDSLNALLDAAESFSPRMPAFTGDSAERKALVDFLLQKIRNGGDR